MLLGRRDPPPPTLACGRNLWAGIDVGGRRKGFDLALVDLEGLRAGPIRIRSVPAAVHWLRWRAPRLVAVDSPRTAAPDGLRSRPEERRVAASVCGIRYTPARDVLLGGNPYYEWIVRGLALYAALEEAGLQTIECFPTASWTRWSGPRGSVRRSAWSQAALINLGLTGVPPRLGQDGRDAIAAAVTARSFECGLTESFGEIVVPLGNSQTRV